MVAKSTDEAARLRTALALFEDGVALMRQNLRRAHPDASAEEIERPGAEHGDGLGRPAEVRV